MENTNDKTLPCPFCGSSNISDGEVSLTDQAGETVVQSMCGDCGACGPGAALDDGEVDYGDVKSRAAWNRRATPAQQTERMQPAASAASIRTDKTFSAAAYDYGVAHENQRGMTDAYDRLAAAADAWAAARAEEARREAARLVELWMQDADVRRLVQEGEARDAARKITAWPNWLRGDYSETAQPKLAAAQRTAGGDAVKVTCEGCKGTGEGVINAFPEAGGCSDCNGKGYDWEPASSAAPAAGTIDTPEWWATARKWREASLRGGMRERDEAAAKMIADADAAIAAARREGYEAGKRDGLAKRLIGEVVAEHEAEKADQRTAGADAVLRDDSAELREWLRQNSAGVYRKAAEAATYIEELERALAQQPAQAPVREDGAAPGADAVALLVKVYDHIKHELRADLKDNRDLLEEVRDFLFSDAAAEAAAQPVEEAAARSVGERWTCFHCSESFTDRTSAALHFGTTERQEPACTIDIVKYREMEATVARYNEEDTDLHRQISRLHIEQHVAAQRAEEKGYARGLKDAAAPTAQPTPSNIDELMSEAARQVSGDTSEKAAHWFGVLVKCARLLDLPEDEPIPSGVLRAVTKLVSAQPTLPDGERAAFEAHFRKDCGMPDSVTFQWDAPYIVAALDGWQARAALRQPPAPPSADMMDLIRETFLAHGFTIKPGQTDLKPYVYEAAQALLIAARGSMRQPQDAEDAARYRWLLENYARGDGYIGIDAALNDGEADKYLSPAIDAARAALTAKQAGEGTK